MNDKLLKIIEEVKGIYESFPPVISSLEISQDVKEIAFAIEEIDLKFDELDGLYNQAMRLCKSLFLENISRVGREALEKALQEEELNRVSVILRDILND